MRNLKKVLSLSLALVMLLGMMVVGAGASTYDDAASITKTEAVDVMSGIGVFTGTGTGFAPQGNLNREQAAAIIARMRLGASANALTVASAPFPDVPTSSWAAPVIAYCTAEGIINGRDNGNFDPWSNVTGTEFAKMLLTALGYNAATQGYLGASWDVNVQRDAYLAGLTNNVGVANMNAPLTREQAAQMALNTEKANVVTQTAGISVNGVTIPGSQPQTITNAATQDYRLNAGDRDTTVQFCELYCPGLKLAAPNTTDDDFGRETQAWTYNGAAVGHVAVPTAVTYTSKVGESTVAKDLADYLVNTTEKVQDTSATTASTATLVKANNAAAAALSKGNGETWAKGIAALTGNGKVVEVYADSNKEISSIIVTQYKVGELSVTVSANGDVSYTVAGMSGIDYASASTADTVVLKGAVADKAIVTAVKPTDGPLYIYPTTSFTGAQSSWNSNGTIVVNGTTYTIGSGVQKSNGSLLATNGTDFANGADAANYYVDQYGFVVATNSISGGPAQYAYIVNAAGNLTVTLDSKAASVEVRAVLTDGTVTTFNLATSVAQAGDKLSDGVTAKNANSVYCGDIELANSGDAATAAGLTTSAETALKGKVFTYNTNSNGRTTLVPVGTAATTAGNAAAVTVTNYKGATSAVNGGVTALMSGQTTFVLYNADTKTARVVVGPAGLGLSSSTPDESDLDGVAVITVAAANIGTAGVVFGNEVTTVVSSGNYAYVDSTKYATTLVNGRNVKVYSAITPEGSTISLTEGDAPVSASGVYNYSTDNTIISAVISGTTIVNAPNGNKGLCGEFNQIGDLVQVSGGTYYATNSNTRTVYTSSSVNAVDGNCGYMVLDSKNNVAAIYVTGASGSMSPASAAITADGTGTVTIAGAGTGSGKANPTATFTHTESGASATGGTGTITVTLKKGGNTVNDSDTIEFTPALPAGATIAVDTADDGKAALDTTNGKITLTYNSGWTSTFKVKVTNGAADVTYTVSVTEAESTKSLTSEVATGSVTMASTNDVQVTDAGGGSGTIAFQYGNSVTPSDGNKIIVTLTAGSVKATIDGVTAPSDGTASSVTVTLTYNGSTSSWTKSQDTVKVIAEDGSYTEYAVGDPTQGSD